MNYKVGLVLVLLLNTITIGIAQSYSDSVKAWRDDYKGKFLSLYKSPLNAETVHRVQFFEIDSNYCVTATFVRTPNEQPFEMNTSTNETAQYVKYGELQFEIDGKACKLNIYQSLRLLMMPGYKDYLFVPFKDKSSHDLVYGGGRYLDFKLSDIKADKLIIDFNKAYNPYCAYSHEYSCPVPPRRNWLSVKVPAGEKLPLDE